MSYAASAAVGRRASQQPVELQEVVEHLVPSQGVEALVLQQEMLEVEHSVQVPGGPEAGASPVISQGGPEAGVSPVIFLGPAEEAMLANSLEALAGEMQAR